MKHLESRIPVDELLFFAKEKQPEIHKYAEDKLRKQFGLIGLSYEKAKDRGMTKAILKSIIVKSWDGR